MLSITICIPTFNREELLKRAINSVAKLIVPDSVVLKILVSDDSYSDDKKNQICSHFNNLDINYIKSNSGGQFFNINNAVHHIVTEWIIILHDDDLMYENYLVDACRSLKIFKNSTMFWGNRYLINDDDKILKVVGPNCSDNFMPLRINGIDYCKAWLLGNNSTLDGTVIPPMVTGLMFKRNIFGNKELFNEKYQTMADGVFIYRILALSTDIVYSPKVNFGYRVSALTERSKLARKGEVYLEYKNHLYEAFSFLGLESTNENIETFNKNFCEQALGINGPITWIALHYQGSLCEYLSVVADALLDLYRKSPKHFIYNFPILPLLLVFTPRIIKVKMAKIYLGY